jgi:hypothetical protein
MTTTVSEIDKRARESIKIHRWFRSIPDGSEIILTKPISKQSSKKVKLKMTVAKNYGTYLSCNYKGRVETINWSEALEYKIQVLKQREATAIETNKTNEKASSNLHTDRGAATSAS